MPQLGLEAHYVEQSAEPIVLPELDYGVRFCGTMRVGQTKRFHWTMPQRFVPALCHDFDRQAAIEVRNNLFPFVKGDLLRAEQGVDKGVVLLARKRAIDVVGARSAGSGLVVARLPPGDRHIDAIAVNDGGNRVKESQRVLAGALCDRICEPGRGEGPGCDDHAVPVCRRERHNLFAPDLDKRMLGERRCDGRREAFAIDGERGSGGHLIGIGAAQDQRAEPAHLLMKKPDRIVLLVVRAQRVGADELRKSGRLVRRRCANGPHFVKDDRHAPGRTLPGGLAPGEPAADDMHRFGMLSHLASMPTSRTPHMKAPAQGGRLHCNRGCGRSAGGILPRNPRYVRSGNPNVGQVAVAEPIELVQACVIAPPGPQEVEDGEQHGSYPFRCSVRC